MPNAETTTRAIAILKFTSKDIHALKVGDRYNDLIVMAEVMDEATYVTHHKEISVRIFRDAPFCATTGNGWVECSLHQACDPKTLEPSLGN